MIETFEDLINKALELPEDQAKVLLAGGRTFWSDVWRISVKNRRFQCGDISL